SGREPRPAQFSQPACAALRCKRIATGALETGPTARFRFFCEAAASRRRWRDLPAGETREAASLLGPVLVAGRFQQESVGFLFRGYQSFGQAASVVLRHTVFPLQETGDALGFDADFDPPQTCQQKIHLVLETDCGTQVLGRRLDALDVTAAHFEQAPARGKFLGS